jgi:hypothetical protein
MTTTTTARTATEWNDGETSARALPIWSVYSLGIYGIREGESSRYRTNANDDLIRRTVVTPTENFLPIAYAPQHTRYIITPLYYNIIIAVDFPSSDRQYLSFARFLVSFQRE